MPPTVLLLSLILLFSAAARADDFVCALPGPAAKAVQRAPESLAAILAACGLQPHEKTFKAEGYTLDNLLSAMLEAVKSDLRELKLTLGECRQLINHLGSST